MAIHDRSESLGELVTRLLDSGKTYVRAEISLVKQTALAWVARAKPAIALLFVALLLVQAALTVAVAAIGMALAHWLGTAGGLAVGALIGLLIAGALAGLAVKILMGSSK